jgi:hypothetical protein
MRSRARPPLNASASTWPTSRTSGTTTSTGRSSPWRQRQRKYTGRSSVSKTASLGAPSTWTPDSLDSGSNRACNPSGYPCGRPGRPPAVELHITLGVRVSFRDGLPALHALSEIGQWVASVVALFAPVFETRKAKRLWNAPRGAGSTKLRFLYAATRTELNVSPHKVAPYRPS